MEEKRLVHLFNDLNEKNKNDTQFFFLEHVLKARGDLHLETGKHEFDQEVNMYLAGLLSSLIKSTTFLHQKPYLSAFDIDVRQWLEKHPGLRNEYVVYKDNADFGLMLLGLFLKYHHQGSYQQRVIPEGNEQGRIAVYYSLAASALSHLQGSSTSLVYIFDSLSKQMEEVLQIIRKVAGSYFDLMERMSNGSIFHLEKEIDEHHRNTLYNQKLDDFLKLFAEYKKLPSGELRERIVALVNELHQLNSNFNFDLKQMG